MILRYFTAPWQKGLPLAVPLNAALQSIVDTVLPILTVQLDEDGNKSVLIVVLEAIENVLIHVGPAVLNGDGAADQLADMLLEIFEDKVRFVYINY